LARPHDASRRNTGKLSGALEFGDESVSIRAGRAAHDAPAELVASMASGILPGLIVGYRAFDGKEPLIVVGDDEEERRGGVGRGRFSNNSQVRCGHWRSLMMLPARLWRLQENVSSLICKNGTGGERFRTDKLAICDAMRKKDAGCSSCSASAAGGDQRR
jgi:hypothetical protein